MNRAQTSLLINGIKLFLRLVAQHVGLNDFSFEGLGPQKRLSFFYGGGGVVNADDFKSAFGKFR
ncbi:MAG: hypothetical protein A3E79_08295 [Burkholderiales bacterium RIFCSPHIGHO2_12_FULL_61_11]|nr:MAG: hypothetical protein A3E79_08295 [Burkholderiales bacterium RIFCSPHIGHO2_12_FULL_61_11]